MEFRLLDAQSRLLAEVRRGNRRRLLHASLLPINDALAVRLATDKHYTALLLALEGIRAPKTVRCLKPGYFQFAESGLPEGLAPCSGFVEDAGYPLIVKPNQLSQGQGVALVRNWEELAAAVEQVWERDYIALLQEAIAGFDFRLDLLDGDLLVAYERRPMILTGTGETTIRELVCAQDVRYAEDFFWKRVGDLADWRLSVQDRGWTQNTVLPAGESIVLGSDVLNLNRFAVAEVRFEVEDRWMRSARRIADVLGLRHLGIDYRLPVGAADPDQAAVIEVNAAPSLTQVYRMGYREEVLAAAQRLLTAAFEEH